MTLARAGILGAILGALVVIGALEARKSIGGRVQVDRALPAFEPVSQILAGLYPVNVSLIAAPEDQGSGGAIDALGDITLLATRRGAFYRLESDADGFRPIALRAPFSPAEIEARVPVLTEVGVRDLKLRRAEDGLIEIVLSHTYVSDAPCVTLRVVALTLSRDDLAGAGNAGSPPPWRRLFETDRCMPVKPALAPYESGGALAFDREGRILVSVGPLGNNGIKDPDDGIWSQDPDHPFGKVHRIDPVAGRSEILTLGHRNQDGLAVAPDGTIWLAEHGPRGGDELNRLEPGGNYGWPLETYGTQYGRFDYPMDRSQTGEHDTASGFALPLVSWSPSNGPSGLEVMRGGEFPLWDGDLLMSTLKGGTIFRIRVREGRAVMVEPLDLGERIRDIAVAGDGTILAKLDQRPAVLRLSNGLDQELASNVYGLSFCTSCHQVDPGKPADAYAAPSLVGIWGAPVARDPDYAYSDALRGLGGRWDELLLRAYIADPQSVAPGTTMPKLDMKGWEIRGTMNALRARADDAG